MGNSEDALADAEASIKYCPFWFKGYFRKAMTLSSLGRYAESFSNLGLCVYLMKATKSDTETALRPVKSEMIKALNKLFPANPNNGQASLRRHTLDQTLFSPYPNQKKALVRNELRQRGYNGVWSESESYSSGDEGDSSLVGSRDSSSGNLARSGRLSNLHHNRGSSMSSGIDRDQTLLRMHRLFSQAMQDVTAFEKRLKSMPSSSRSMDDALIVAPDFECSLCYRLLHQPITTPCGHTYCRSCLERCLDHSPNCPLCKASLEHFLSKVTYRKQPVTQIVESVISKYLSKDYAERIKMHLEELSDVNKADSAEDIEIPIFVCTMAFPTIPCPLHVFEPRYRLMIRRCMESGSERFGMCCYIQDNDHNYGEYGTLLHVKGVQYFPDGRSIVNTVGESRFKVLRKFMKDGYNAATVRLIKDQKVEGSEEESK
jgi:hypothetical protein